MESWLNSIGLVVVGAVLSLAVAVYMFRRTAALEDAKDIAAEHKALIARVAELEAKLTLVNQTVVPINMAMQALLIKELTHYHTPEMDRLMEKLGPPATLTESDELRLALLLEERTRDMGPLITPGERDAAAILPIIVKRARAEAETLTGAEQLRLKLVTVAAVVGLPITVAPP
jgi:hypothetical protein